MTEPDLVAAANRLATVLERENAALTRMDIPAASNLLDAKSEAIAALEALDPRLNPRGDAELEVAARRLDALVRENRTLLKRAMAAQEHVIRIVADAIALVMAPQASYGGPRQIARPPMPRSLSTRA